MAFINPDDHSGSVGLTAPDSIQNMTTAQNIVISPMGLTEVPLPGGGFVTNAVMTQEGGDLILESPDGVTLVIEGYFSGDAPPNLVSDGKVLTPALVKSFIQASTDYAEDKVALNDVTPIGQAHEVSGNAFVTHQDGSKEAIVKGTPIYEGDIVETDAQGAVNIKFVDESSFAVSNNAKMAIDEFVYDSTTHGGENNFSMLRGLFVYTSGLVGREDPDDVKIETPVGSIGIRGTIITGSLPGQGSTEPAKISVVEGAIVIEDRNGQSVTLSQQFETVQIDANGMKNIGVMPGAEMTQTFNVLRTVAPTLFSAVEEAQQDITTEQPAPAEAAPVVEEVAPSEEAPAQETAPVEPQPLPDVIQLNLMPGTLDPVTTDKALANNTTNTMINNSPIIDLAALGSTRSLSNLIPSTPSVTSADAAPVTSPNASDPSAGTSNPPPTIPNNAPTPGVGNYYVLEQSGFSSNSFTFSLRDLFNDPDGDNLTYTISEVYDPNDLISGVSVDTAGTVTYNVSSNTFGGNFSIVTFSASASDGSLSSVPITMNVNIYNITQTYTVGDDNLSITTNLNRVNLDQGNDSLTINGSENIAFGGQGEDSFTIFGGNNNKVHGQEGTDTLSILGGIDNLAAGGAGADNISVNVNSAAESYKLFGGMDNDIITIGNAASFAALLGGNSVVDGGEGFDTLVLGPSVTNINISAFPLGSVMNIEKLQMLATGPATVTLDISLLFINGNDRSLYLDVDGNDFVNITNTGFQGALVATGQTVSDGTETYNVYSNGQSTLYLSTDANMANVTGI